MKKPSLPPPLSLLIQGYGSDGQGVAHLPDGMTCFVATCWRSKPPPPPGWSRTVPTTGPAAAAPSAT